MVNVDNFRSKLSSLLSNRILVSSLFMPELNNFPKFSPIGTARSTVLDDDITGVGLYCLYSSFFAYAQHLSIQTFINVNMHQAVSTFTSDSAISISVPISAMMVSSAN